jgi:phosphoglycolate phosphatase-like HAD superfamily hydrolase
MSLGSAAMRKLPFLSLLAALLVAAPAAGAATPVVQPEPTGAGLPDLGTGGTYGAGDIAPAIRAYRTSGAWDRDIDAVVKRARAGVKQRVKLVRARGGKPAIVFVFDIDETTLSNYAFWDAADFKNGASVAAGIVQGTDPAIPQTKRLFDLGARLKVKLVFITGRPDALRAVTKRNLTTAGYAGYKLVTRGDDGNASVVPYKSGARKALYKHGYEVVANLGDQYSDLAGGFADAAYKIADPMYFIP